MKSKDGTLMIENEKNTSKMERICWRTLTTKVGNLHKNMEGPKRKSTLINMNDYKFSIAKLYGNRNAISIIFLLTILDK